MAQFNTFLDILPDPIISIGEAGQAGGTAGQGFAKVSLTKPDIVDVDRTIFGRTISRRQKYPMWQVQLNYNPMTKEQFDPIYSFLLEKQNGLRPFFVVLPQYRLPKDVDFANYVQSTNTITTTSSALAGYTYMEIEDTEGVTEGTNIPKFGDLFHIEDSNDSFHTKAYMVDRVETSGSNVTPPTTGSIRVHFSPALQRNVANGALVEFNSPKLFVRQVGNVQEYALDNAGLYNFSLKLEEVSY